MPVWDIVEAQWGRLPPWFRAVPHGAILSRGIEREVLPTAQRHGLGALVWGPLGQGMLTGRVRRGQENTLRRAGVPPG
ncbi:MAG: hypothetical protein QOI78_6461 [Actinomycetota bacterium]|nr:hypothetical protein [Actinomycetota bacterium]